MIDKCKVDDAVYWFIVWSEMTRRQVPYAEYDAAYDTCHTAFAVLNRAEIRLYRKILVRYPTYFDETL